MKLSEAIRLRGMMDRQVFGHYIDEAGGSCALGGAALAIGFERKQLFDYGFEACLCVLMGTPKKWLALKWRECPEKCGAPVPYECLFTTIAHLNDDHRWSREQIADWVSTIEQEHERQQPAEVQKEQVTA